MKKVAGIIAAGALGADLLAGACGTPEAVSCAPYERVIGEPTTLDARVHALGSAIFSCYNAAPSAYKGDERQSAVAELDLPFKNGDLLKILASAQNTFRDDSNFANKIDDVSMTLLNGDQNTSVKYSVELSASRGGMVWGASSNKETDYLRYSTITAGKLDVQEMPTDTEHVEATSYSDGSTYKTDDSKTTACVELQLFDYAKNLLTVTTDANATPNMAEPVLIDKCVLV